MLSVIANVVLKFAASALHEDTPFSYAQFLPTTIFSFKSLVGGRQSLLYKLIEELTGPIHSSADLMRGGPHCVRHVTWGTGIKPFYRDSLNDLRRELYITLQVRYSHVFV